MAEIKISELSIGDWVKIDGVPKRVHSIEYQNGEYFVHFSDPDINSEDYMHAPFIKPIPLTPEILEKNGFEKNSECCWRNSAIECACLRYGTKYWDIRINGRNRAYRPTRISIDNILHTHQLQNALRLAGVGKEIEV